MSTSEHHSVDPKSIRHKQILDVAAEDPDASFAELADEVPSATADLVERVLEEYGDPADATPVDADGAPTGESPDEETATDSADTPSVASAHPGETPSAADAIESASGSATATAPSTATADRSFRPDLADLSTKERETLRAIRERPSATQSEIAEDLGVSRATVSNRVNGIDGFEWTERAAFVEDVFGDAHGDRAVADGAPRASATTPAEGSAGSSPSAPSADVTESLGELADRLAAVEDRLKAVDAADEGDEREGSAFDDPELAQKVVHACVNAENVSEDEELRIIRALLE